MKERLPLTVLVLCGVWEAQHLHMLPHVAASQTKTQPIFDLPFLIFGRSRYRNVDACFNSDLSIFVELSLRI